MMNSKQTILGLCLIIALLMSLIIYDESNKSIFNDSTNINYVSRELCKNLNNQIKSSQNLQYDVVVLGMNRNKLVIATILENRIFYTKNFGHIEYLDTIYYLCNHKYKFSNYTFEKIQDKNIDEYIDKNKFITIKSWFNN